MSGQPIRQNVFSILGVNLPNLSPIDILRPNMDNQYAHLHHHILPPHGREVARRAPVIE